MIPPYRPRYERTALLVRWLTHAADLAAWIRQQSVDVSWVPRAQRQALVRSAHHSTRIEGNPLTLPEVEALADGRDLPVEERAKREVLNYFAALRWVWRKSPRKILGERDLLKLHALLTTGTIRPDDVGVYKRHPNAVFKGREVIYRPPPPEAASLLTRALLTWMGSPGALSEHPAVVAAVAHHRLVSIHPVADGNGRLARALGAWVLYRRGFDTHHIFALDEYFDTDRPRYYWQIQKVRQEGDDLTGWVEYVAEGVVETLRKTQRRIQGLLAGEPAKRIVLNRQQERVLQVLGMSPRMGGRELAETLGLSRSQLSKVMGPLLAARLVLKEGSTKSARYRLGGRKKDQA